MKTAMQVYATLKRKVTAITFLLSMMIMVGWPISQSYAQQVYATSQTSGRTGICLLCAAPVTTPGNAVSASHTDYATFNLDGVAVGVSVFETLQFPSVNPNPGCDSLVIQIGAAQSLLTANLLSNITITTFNGATSNGDATTVTPGLLQLLGDSSTALIVIRPTAAFDRVEIRESALIAALSTLRLYYAYHTPINLNNITVANGSAITVCSGTPATLTASVPAGGATIQWYTQPTGGAPVASGTSYTFTPTANTTVYAGAILGGCSSTTRKAVAVNVNAAPATPAVAVNTATICSGQTATFSVSAPQGGVTYTWYDASTGGNAVGTGAVFITPALTANTTYYAEASLVTGCTSTSRAPVTVTVNAVPVAPVVTPASQTINAGNTATIAISNPVAGVTYNWYTTSAGGTAVGTGTSFTTPALYTNTNYYAEVTSAQSCVNTSRTLATVAVVTNNNTSCSFATTQQSPVYTNGICALCSVTNAANAIDTDTSTASSISVPVSIAGYTGQLLTYPHSYFIGDSVRLQLGLPGNVADIQALGGIRVETYFNGVANGDAVLVNNPAITLNLIGGSRFNVTLASTKNFNAVLVSLGGTASLLSTLNIYGASVIVPRPVVTPATGTICTGSTASFTVTSPTNADIAWYTTPVGGTAVATGTSFTTPALTTTTTYYVEAGLYGCANVVRTPVTIQVNAQPAAPIPATANASVCEGQTTTIAVTPVTGVTFNWYASDTGSTPLATGNNFTTPALTTTTTYFVGASNGGCNSATRTPATITVNAAPSGVSVTPAGAAISAGQSVTFTASATSGAANFNWFTTATGGTSIASGASFTTPLLFANTTYYVEASNAITGCTSTSRVAVTVTVNDPNVPDISCGAAGTQTNGASGLCVGCYVENPTLAVDNSSATASTLHVILGLLGGYVQQTFTFPSVSNGDSVYIGLSFPTGLADAGLLSGIQVQSYNGAVANNDLTTINSTQLTLRLANNEATAGFLPTVPYDRIEVRLNSGALQALNAVNINYVQRFVSIPTVQSDSVFICGGQPATLTALTPAGATFRWYSQPTGGTPLFTGASFITPAVTANTVYYVEAVSADGCPSPSRKSVTVIAGLPSVSVTPTAITLNPGETATFNVTNPNAAYTYTWYDAPSGGNLLHTGTSYTTGALQASTNVYVMVSDASGCTSTTRTQVSINITIPVDPAPCSYATTETSPVTSGGACILCSVTDAALAVDSNRNTASTINSVIGVAGYYGQTLHFPNTYPAGDSVSVELEIPGKVADVQLLGGVRFETYLGATANGDGRILTDSVVSLSLLPSGNRFRITVPVSRPFDGVNISVGGVVSAVTTLLVYDAAAVIPSPAVTPVAGICSGNTATLTATGPANATITWYTQAVGGAAAGTGYTFVTPALTTTTTYYAAAGRFGCNSPARTPVTITVGNAPAAPTVANANICAGTTATLVATAPQNVTFQWYANATDTTVLFTGNSFTTAALNADTTFYVASNSNGCRSSRVPVTVTAGTVPAAFNVTPNTATIAYGSTVTFTATATDTAAIFNFYTQASGGIPVFTGKVFTTPSLITNTTYYAEASTVAGCVTNFRIPLVITVLTDSTNGVVPCDAATTQTNTTNNACIGCYVENPLYAVDTSTATGATLHTILGLVGGYVSQTLIFPSVSEVGDSVHVDLTTTSGLADVGLLSDVQVGTYNGATFNNDLQAINSGPITLRLLSNNEVSFVFKPTALFDRIEVRLNSGLLQALNAVTIRDAYRKVAVPVVNGNDTTTICAGQTVSLSVVPVANVTMRWYTQLLGGTPVFTGNNYITPALNNNTTFFVEAVKTSTGCAATPRVPVTVIVLPVPATPQVLVDTVTMCVGSRATFQATTPAGAIFRWYTVSTGGTPVGSGATFTTPALATSTIYYLEAGNAGGCANVMRKAVLANVVTTPAPPAVTPTSATICAHNNTTLLATSATPGLIYNWYTTATGGTPVSVGPAFTTPILDSTTTYYAETVAGSCASNTRTAAVVTVNPAPSAPVITPASATANLGDVKTFTADSTITGITYNWYTVISGGSPVFTGNKFITPALTSNITYYVEAAAVAGCTSTRTAVPITVNGGLPACDFATTQTNATSGICIGCSITNPGLAIDADTTTFSTLSLPLGLGGGNLEQTLILPQAANAGDTVRIALEIPSQLVNAGLISGLQLATYNGATYNDDRANVNLSTITLNVISGSDKFYVNYVPQSAYDRVEVTLNAGFLGAALNLNVYYGALKPVTPSVNPANVSICSGSTTTLHATAPPSVRIEWYSAPVGGTLLHTGGDYPTSALTATTTFYVQTVRISSNCANPNRVPVTVSVLPVPVVTIVGGNRSICAGQPVSISATVNDPSVTIRWYNAATNGTLVFTGNPLVTTILSRDTAFYAEGYNGTCASVARAAVQVTVGQTTLAPVLQNNNVAICAGQSATIVVNSDTTGLTLRWYTAAFGGTPIFTGATFNTGVLTANAIYYVEAMRSGGTCNNPSTRTIASVQVTPIPATPVLTSTTDTVCAGQSIALSVQNPQAGVSYQWYNLASGGTLLFTGAVYNIASVDSSQSYYVQANNGCTSGARATVRVTARTAPVAPTLQASSINICSGQTATLSILNPVGTITYRWYDAAVGGNLLATGNSFTTPVLTTAATYYVSASNVNCTSATRTTASVTVGTPTTPTLDNNNVNTCAGQKVTFTVTSPTAGIIYRWYNAPTGGTLLFTGTAFTTNSLMATSVFFVDATSASGGCGGTSTRVAATANVTPAPVTPVLAAPNVQTCGGSAVTFNVTNPQGNLTYQWFDAAIGGTLLATGNAYTVNNIMTTTSYYVQALNGNGCASAVRAKATATVSSTPLTPVLASDTVVTCIGGTATFTIQNPDAALVYTWYDAAAGGTLLGTGTSYTSVALTTNRTFFAQAAYPNGGCVSAARALAQASVVNNLPVPTVTDPAVVACSGQPLTISVQNPQTGILYRWYTANVGGTPVFTGPSYTITGVNSNRTYYVEAATTAGCVSTSRAAVAITLSTSPATPALTSNTVTVCTGEQATLSIGNPQAGLQYNWYNAAAGGTLLATGATYKTPVITGTTNFYAEAQNITGGCTSPARAVATVTLLPAGATPTVTGSQIICPGTSTTLTASSTTPGALFSWYTSDTATVPVYTGNSYTTPVLITSATFYVQAAPGTFCGTTAKESADVNVEQQLAAPVVTVCDSSQTTSVTFCWSPVQGAQSYEVSIDNGLTFTVPSAGATATTHVVTGLQPNQRVSFEVKALGQLACANSAIAAIGGHSAAAPTNVVYIPNVFSPNGDGENDVLMVYGQSVNTMELIIFNKWGQDIFTSKDQHTGWDGRASGQLQPVGVYAYVLKAVLNDGTKITRYGTITLIR